MKIPQVTLTKQQRIRDIASKKYYCSDCDKAFRDKSVLNAHLSGLKHNPDRLVKHTCLPCNYTTRVKANLNKHMMSVRHIRICSHSEF